jgi:F0F1-type ATP synthase assembly protein I
MLVATWAVGVHLNDLINASIDLDDWFVVLVGSMLGASMGFHNVAAKESITGCPPTTVMTSTLVNIACAGANTLGFILASFNIMRLTPPTGPKGTYLPLTIEESHALSLKAYAEFQKFIPLIRPIVSFLIGAVIGAVTMKYAEFYCLVIPIFFLLVILSSIIMKIFDQPETDNNVVSDKQKQEMLSSPSVFDTKLSDLIPKSSV